jgi:branched-chain amino acid transport system substrate-binding protein
MGRSRTRLLALLVTLGAVGLVCGCRARTPFELRIGLILPMTGSLQSLATNSLGGARLAVDQLEKAGGLTIDGRPCAVVLIARDAETSPEMAVAAAQELINKENVSAIIAPPLSGQAIPVMQLTSRAGVPAIVHVATNPDVTKGTTDVIRMCFVDVFQGAVLARFACGKLGARRAAVLYDETSPFPRDIARVFRTQFQASGGELVAVESFTTGELDFRRALGRIAISRPDVLFLPNYRADLLQIGPQIREIGLTVQILGCDTMRFATPEDTRLYDGAYVTAHFVPDSPEAASRGFSDAYRRAYGSTPIDSAALAYDAINLLIQVARQQRSVEPKAIAKGLAAIREYQGVTGTMRWDGSPDPAKSVVVAVIREGELAFETQVDP